MAKVTILVGSGERQVPVEVDLAEFLKHLTDQTLMARHMGQNPDEPVRGLEDSRSFYDLAIAGAVKATQEKKA